MIPFTPPITLHKAPHGIAEIATLAEALPIRPAVSEFETRHFPFLLDVQNETAIGTGDLFAGHSPNDSSFVRKGSQAGTFGDEKANLEKRAIRRDLSSKIRAPGAGMRAP